MRKVVALALLALAGTACTGEPEAVSLATEATERLDEIRSGVIDLRVEMSASGAVADAAGFELQGPFSLPDEGELPVADLEVTRFAGDETITTGFIGTGTEAFVELDGTVYELPADQAASLLGTGTAEDPVLGELEVDTWLIDPEPLPAGDLGEGLVGLTAELDVPVALEDLLDAAASTGAIDPVSLTDDEAGQLRAAVRRATVRLVAGADDRLVRELEVEVELASEEVPEIAGLVAAGFSLELAIERPNEAVTVDRPAGARPYEELPG